MAPILSDDVTISASGPYTVTISSIDLANSLTFSAPQAALVESAGELLVDGALTVTSGFVSLNEANAFSNVAITGGTLAFGNTGALAAGAVVLNGGELLATANVTLNNALSILGPSTIAAAHGTTLNLGNERQHLNRRRAGQPHPGPTWKAVGTGDFNDDGHSDILFQDTTSGQVSIWEMNRNTLVGGGTVSANLGPGWKAIGTGDFNGDGHSDILFQNTTSGQVSIQEMNGTKVTGDGTVSANPGLSWRAIGTGDFNGDGHSDILFQNASGHASIWEMNGTNVIGGGAVSSNPGASWRAVA